MIEQQRQILFDKREEVLQTVAAIDFFESRASEKFDEFKSLISAEALNRGCRKLKFALLRITWTMSDMRVLKRLFTWMLKAAFALAVLLLPALWLVTLFGRWSLTPPGWVAVLSTLLPYLYAGLFLFCLVLFCVARHKTLLVIMGSLLISFLLLWGGLLVPQKTDPPDGLEPVKVMVWNVQRMGEFSGRGQSVSQQVQCVSQTISREQPDIFALLEVTYNQLLALQQQLGIPRDHCLWSDYYGTGQQRFGGLATCIFDQNNDLMISHRRELNLPPNWKYLFIEVQHTQNKAISPINVLALHIAPPEIPPEEVMRILADVFRGQKQGIGRAINLLANYERQVQLQGTQAGNALQVIARFRDPTIMAGDFNSTQDAALHVRFRDSLKDTWATAGFGFGATRHWGDFLPLRIDYIYVTKEFAVQDSQTLACDCSDHLPVVSSVFLTPAATRTK